MTNSKGGRMRGYFMKPAFVRQSDGGNLIVGPFQLNWYGKGVRLHVTWPMLRTIEF
jgi:hypothetical protein